jgi:hypothetical protein
MGIRMTPRPTTMRLAEFLQSFEAPAGERDQRLLRVREHLYARSKEIRHPDFRAIHTNDLALLFEGYDREFFDGQLRAALAGRRLTFDLSRRTAGCTESPGAPPCWSSTHRENYVPIAGLQLKP